MDQESIVVPSNSWLATYADLMSLLMCFFVLLLAFSEMDVLKMKDLAGSMRFAFGVQNQVQADQIPKGTSIIAREFSPGKPQETPIKTLQQHAINSNENSIEFQSGEERSVGGKTDELKEIPNQDTKENEKWEKLNADLHAKLKEPIENKQIELENLGEILIIRINERGSFSSGSAFIQPKMVPYLKSIVPELNRTAGEIRVSGHTDSLAINNELFDSNWDLAAARALSVAKVFTKNNNFDNARLVVESLADNRPLLSAKTRLAQAKNRRVEISIQQGKAKVSQAHSISQKRGN